MTKHWMNFFKETKKETAHSTGKTYSTNIKNIILQFGQVKRWVSQLLSRNPLSIYIYVYLQSRNMIMYKLKFDIILLDISIF